MDRKSKTKKEAQLREFTVVIEKDVGGYFFGFVPQLKGCHTQAKSMDKLVERIKEAIELCLETQDEEVPESRFVGIHRVTVDL